MYNLAYFPSCKKEIKKHIKKNEELRKALKNKLEEIIFNPYKFKPLTGPLAGLRRVHIMKSFVLLYKVEEKTKTVILVRFVHHDEAYK